MNITVAIPSYNKEKYIKRCIESALLNKEHIAKIILVDNNSTDRTLEIAKQYEPAITCYKNESNLGMAKNWNRCIDLCDTEWLLILHADDELLPDGIQKYKALVAKHPTLGLIHANSCSIIEGDSATKSFTTSTQKEFWHKGLEAMSCNYGVCSAVMVRKKVYDTLGYFIESLSSDAEMWSRIASKYDVGFITEPTVIYHVSKSSTGYESLIKRNVKDIKKDWDFLNERITHNYPTEESRNAFITKSKKDAVGGYFVVVKANLREGNFIKAFQAVLVIIFVYKGLFELLKIVLTILKKYLKKLF